MKFTSSGKDRVIRTSSAPSKLAMDDIKDPQQLTYNLMKAKPRTNVHQYKHVRLSEVGTFCPREYVIGFLNGKKSFSQTPFAMLQQFGIGSALHWYVQNHPDQYFGADKFLGFWFCLACQKTRRFGVKPKDSCEHCGAHQAATVYKEWKFKITEPYPVVGMLDGIIKVAPGVYRMVELKSYIEDGKKTSPDAKDVAQTAAYIYFSQFSEEKLPIELDRGTGYIVYISKKFSYTSPIRTFQVNVTDTLMNPLIAKVDAVGHGYRTGALPECRSECVAKRWRTGRAKNCQRKEDCERYHVESSSIIPAVGGN